jgi:hypothetical protein
MGATPDLQSLRFNADSVSFWGGANADIVFDFLGTSNAGQFKWMEDENYFEFADSIMFPDNVSLKLGTASDATILFDGNSLNIVANAVTGTDALEFTAGSYKFQVPADTDIALNFTGTTNSGVLTWMEDEDYFKFSDSALIEKNALGSTQTAAFTLQNTSTGAVQLAPAIEFKGNAYSAGDYPITWRFTPSDNAGIGAQFDIRVLVPALASDVVPLRMNYDGTVSFIDGNVKIFSDSKKLLLGAADDASIIYNGTNLVINPKEVGTGMLDVAGVLQTDGYKSSDGTAGATAAVAVAKVGGGTRTLSFKDGLYTGYTDS